MSLVSPAIVPLTAQQQAIVDARHAELIAEDEREVRTANYLIDMGRAFGIHVVMTGVRPNTFTVEMPTGGITECHSRLRLGALLDSFAAASGACS